MSPGNRAADALLERQGRSAHETPAGRGDADRCDRCAHANTLPGGRVDARKPSLPVDWDAGYRMCQACRGAVEVLLDATGTRPTVDADGTWVHPTHPAHTGHPHYLWRPDIRGLASQIGQAPAAAASPLHDRVLLSPGQRRGGAPGSHNDV